MEQELRKQLKRVAPYPPGVVEVPEAIKGTAFFPGGRGLWMEDGIAEPKFPTGKIMVLGHDFHSKAGYDDSFKKGKENPKGSTWRNITKLLTEAHVELSDVFFTNFYMGLREKDEKTGKFPGADDPAFVERCRAFFLAQAKIQQPKVVLTLGNYVPGLIAPLAPQLAQWRDVEQLKELDKVGALVHGVRFAGVKHPVAVLALTHPSLRHLNIAARRYNKDPALKGHEAELELLNDALSSIH